MQKAGLSSDDIGSVPSMRSLLAGRKPGAESTWTQEDLDHTLSDLNAQISRLFINHGQDGRIDLHFFGESDAVAGADFGELQQGVQFRPVLHMPLVGDGIDRPVQVQILFIERGDFAVMVGPDEACRHIA